MSAYKLINESFLMCNFENTNWALDIPQDEDKKLIEMIHEKDKDSDKIIKFLCHSGH